MRKSFVCLISRLLVICLIGLPFEVNAGMIGTDEVVSAAQAQAARATVNSFVSRTDVAGQLHVLGLTAQNAKDRVAALTDTEVAKLAGQIDKLPAGAHSNPVSVLLVFILVGVLIWWALERH